MLLNVSLICTKHDINMILNNFLYSTCRFSPDQELYLQVILKENINVGELEATPRYFFE